LRGKHQHLLVILLVRGAAIAINQHRQKTLPELARFSILLDTTTFYVIFQNVQQITVRLHALFKLRDTFLPTRECLLKEENHKKLYVCVIP